VSSSVKVASLEELRDFAAAVAAFVDQANDALLAVDMETRRFVDWIRNEQPRRWRQAQQQCNDEVAQANAALVRKKLHKRDDGREPDATEELKALRKAKQRLEYVEEKIAQTRKWGKLIDQPVNEYIGQARQLGVLLEGDPPSVLRFLRAAIAGIESYMEVEAPRTADAHGVQGASGVARSTASEADPDGGEPAARSPGDASDPSAEEAADGGGGEVHGRSE
jgi:hypothetical protein